MRATVRYFHSPDVSDMETYLPPDIEDFGFLLQVMVGPGGEKGEESFDVMVCSPDWFKRHAQTNILLGRHYLFMLRYDWKELESFVRTFVDACDGETWREIALKLSRLGAWEFEDYRPPPL